MAQDEPSEGAPGDDPGASAPEPTQAAPAEVPPAAATAAASPLPAARAVDGAGTPPEPPLAQMVRKADEALGLAERVAISLIFLALVLIGFYRTLADLAWNERPLWAIEGIRVAVFAIAMLGAAFATHHRRNFSLDLVTRFLQPRGRAILRLVLILATLLAAGLLLYGGMIVHDTLAKEHEYDLVPKWVIGWFIPVAAGLIIVHNVAHLIIELAYLVQGRTAPEPEQAVG